MAQVASVAAASLAQAKLTGHTDVHIYVSAYMVAKILIEPAS